MLKYVRPLTKKDLNTYGCINTSNFGLGKCQINETTNDAIITWNNPESMWDLTLGGNGLVVVQEDRREVTPKQLKYKYIALTIQREYKNALKTCKSLGGRLPMPSK